jgi:hypothetical protein
MCALGRKFAFARSRSCRSNRFTAERQVTNSLQTGTTHGGMAALAEEQSLPEATFTVRSWPGVRARPDARKRPHVLIDAAARKHC